MSISRALCFNRSSQVDLFVPPQMFSLCGTLSFWIFMWISRNTHMPVKYWIFFITKKSNRRTMREKYLHLRVILPNILLLTGAVSTGNIERTGRGDNKEKEFGRAPSMANCLSTTVPVNLAACQIAGRHTPTRNSLRHSRMIVMHRTGHCELLWRFFTFQKTPFYFVLVVTKKNLFLVKVVGIKIEKIVCKSVLSNAIRHLTAVDLRLLSII